MNVILNQYKHGCDHFETLQTPRRWLLGCLPPIGRWTVYFGRNYPASILASFELFYCYKQSHSLEINSSALKQHDGDSVFLLSQQRKTLRERCFQAKILLKTNLFNVSESFTKWEPSFFNRQTKSTQRAQNSAKNHPSQVKWCASPRLSGSRTTLHPTAPFAILFTKKWE